ncbi:MAG TPA: hypothetical protein VKN99_03695 [Polyangia bacterium]|nr:hypothetical protein [Polyangia bacterium]
MRRLRWLACGLLAAGCYDFDGLSSNFNVSGQYSVNVTNGANGCNFADWSTGAMSSGIPLAITQNGSNVVATIGGLAGDWVNFVCGGRDLVGTVDKGTLQVGIACTKAQTQGTCTYRIVAQATATVSGDAIMGTIDYSTVTNNDPGCGTLQSCHNQQRFNGARPPTH